MVGMIVTVALLVFAGLVGVTIAWQRAADTSSVALQLPYLVSGALGGIALIGFALGVANIQASRRRAAAERAEFARLVDAAVDVLAAARGAKR